jgi:hypothetical protein
MFQEIWPPELGVGPTCVPTVFVGSPVRSYFVVGLLSGAAGFGTVAVTTQPSAAAMHADTVVERTLPTLPPDVSNPIEGRSVATRLQRLRSRTDLSWGDVARAIAVSRRTIHNWLSGAQIAPSHLARLGDLETLVDYCDRGRPAITRDVLTRAGPYGRNALDEFAIGSRPSRRVPLSPVSAGDLLSPDEPGPDADTAPEKLARPSSLRGGPIRTRQPNQ